MQKKKNCSICLVNPRYQYKNRFSSYCKSCKSEKQKIKYKENPDTSIQNAKNWQAKNADKIKKKQEEEKEARRLWRIANPTLAMQKKNFIKNILDTTAPEYNECILYPFKLDSLGYGRISWGKGRTSKVHRIVLEEVLGRLLKPGFETSHVCHNRSCVNPNHLSEETHTENIRKSIEAGHYKFERNWFVGNSRKFSNEEVFDIRKKYFEGLTMSKLANLYSCNEYTISNVIHWRGRYANDLKPKIVKTSKKLVPLTRLQVLMIKWFYSTGIYTMNDLAGMFGKGRSTIYKCVNNIIKGVS